MGRSKQKEAWAIRYWRWRPDVNREDGTADLVDQQQEVWRRFPSEAMARAMGPRIVSRDPDVTSPGLFDLMRGTPDRHSMDGWDWQITEEVRP
jgi:hypothetical protein